MPQLQGTPSQHGRMYPHPSHRSWEVSQRIKVLQFGQVSVRSAMEQGEIDERREPAGTAVHEAHLIDGNHR